VHRVDEHEFDELYVASFARLVRQLHLLTGSAEEARDCVQEAFARAWTHRRDLSHSQHPEAWVRQTAHRLAVSRWRRLQLAHRHADRAIARDQSAPPPNPDHVTLVRAMAQLPADQRRALVLFHIADLSVEQVAAETGSPTGTVKARLSRGRVALAVLLSDSTEGASHA
jgi:RNA polymerase sigma-70 factor, ECF subfamily